jgi:hypothetical protein
MVRGLNEVQHILNLGYSIFGFNYSLYNEFTSALAFLACDDEAIVNVGANSESGCSIKFEFPRIDSATLPSLFHFTKCEYDTWRSARQIAQYLKRETFPYLGVRFSSIAQRELTFYIDARPILQQG